MRRWCSVTAYAQPISEALLSAPPHSLRIQAYRLQKKTKTKNVVRQLKSTEQSHRRREGRTEGDTVYGGAQGGVKKWQYFFGVKILVRKTGVRGSDWLQGGGTTYVWVRSCNSLDSLNAK